MKMKLYLLRAKMTVPYDSYDSQVVAAHSPQEARKLCANGDECNGWIDGEGHEYPDENIWLKPKYVKLKYLGETILKSPQVVCASFHAG